MRAEYGSLCEIKEVFYGPDSQVQRTRGCKLIHESLNFSSGRGVYVLRRTPDTAILNSARERHMPPTHPQH